MASKESKADDLVDNSIVHGFQNLRVLTPYDFHQMDELVQDLTLALEETSRNRKSKHGNDSSHKKTKRKSKKRKSSNPSNNTLGGCNVTEGTESSIDEALKEYMESITQLSDSDDLILNGKAAQTLDTLLKFSSQSISVAESDSYTENSPMRPSRRRRRFKRMAVDVQPDSEISIVEYLNEQRLKRLSTLKPKFKIQEHKIDMDSETSIIQSANSDSQATPTKQETSLNLSGKRKRCIKAGSSFDCVIDEEGCSETSGSNNKTDAAILETSSSSIGSNSNSCSDGDSIYTDGGREGDDEQSDFYHEPGPACGIPGIIPWWETDRMVKGEPENYIADDETFNQILTGSFKHMSKKSQRSFMSRLKLKTMPGREIRLGRRRLKDRKPAYSLSKFIQDREKWKENTRHIGGHCRLGGYHLQNRGGSGDNNLTPDGWNEGHGSNGCGSSSQHGETKRRRKTPPTTPDGSVANEMVGAHAEPIPESNVGNRLLQAMGWDPGSGLGPNGSGITTPITAFKRSGRKGLGAGNGSSNTSSSSMNQHNVNSFVHPSHIGC